MCPVPTIEDMTYCSTRNVKIFRQLSFCNSTIRKSFSYCKNISLREFGHCLSFSFRLFISVLVVHVARIVQICSKKKVIWSDTSRIVAPMQDVHSMRYFSEMDFPGCSVCSDVLALRQSNSSVSFGYISYPYPAVIRLQHLIPKSIDKRPASFSFELAVSSIFVEFFRRHSVGRFNVMIRAAARLEPCCRLLFLSLNTAPVSISK